MLPSSPPCLHSLSVAPRGTLSGAASLGGAVGGGPGREEKVRPLVRLLEKLINICSPTRECRVLLLSGVMCLPLVGLCLACCGAPEGP